MNQIQLRKLSCVITDLHALFWQVYMRHLRHPDSDLFAPPTHSVQVHTGCKRYVNNILTTVRTL